MAAPGYGGGPFDFISVCPPYLLVSYPELFQLLEVRMGYTLDPWRLHHATLVRLFLSAERAVVTFGAMHEAAVLRSIAASGASSKQIHLRCVQLSLLRPVVAHL